MTDAETRARVANLKRRLRGRTILAPDEFRLLRLHAPKFMINEVTVLSNGGAVKKTSVSK